MSLQVSGLAMWSASSMVEGKGENIEKNKYALLRLHLFHVLGASSTLCPFLCGHSYIGQNGCCPIHESSLKHAPYITLCIVPPPIRVRTWPEEHYFFPDTMRDQLREPLRQAYYIRRFLPVRQTASDNLNGQCIGISREDVCILM